jgi:iron(III) transport system substrate-binding protein
VATGEVDFALVDSDDAVNRLKQGKVVEMIFPDQEADGMGCLILPNAVLMIQGAPHQDAARKLIDYLLSSETEQKLAFADCAQIPLHRGVKVPPEVPKIETLHVMQFSHVQMAQKMQEIQPILKSWAGL